ncbi:hypothetical protein V8F20_009392 [Naviculisporaceae sp. PSN 640]
MQARLSSVSLLLAMVIFTGATPTPGLGNTKPDPGPGTLAPRRVWTLQCTEGLTKGCERKGYYCDQNGRMWGTWVQACDDHCGGWRTCFEEMSAMFCCSSITPFRPRYLDHEAKFSAFIKWAGKEPAPDSDSSLVPSAPYAIQVVKQVNYGPQESIRCFVPCHSNFKEATEDALVEANLKKVNSPVSVFPFSAFRFSAFRFLTIAQLAMFTKAGELTARCVTLDTRTSDALGTTSSLSSIFTRRMPPVPITGVQIWPLEKNFHWANSYPGDLRDNRIMMLLSLDKVNTDLHLDLDIDKLWATLLGNYHSVIAFFWNCVILESKKNRVDVTIIDIENIVVHCVRCCEYDYQNGRIKDTGRERLKNIVKSVLRAGRSHEIEWVMKFGHLVENAVESGVPSADVAEALYQSRRNASQIIVPKGQAGLHSDSDQSQADQKQEDGSSGETDEDRSIGLDDERDVDEDDYGNYNDDFSYSYDREYYSSSPQQDFTACDKECGYCGHCD